LQPFEPKADKDFAKFLDENKNELTPKIGEYFDENIKDMRSIHQQI
jgi:hypothetical protein